MHVTSSGDYLLISESHSSTVWAAAFDKTGTRLVSSSDDNTVKIWQEYPPNNKEGKAYRVGIEIT